MTRVSMFRDAFRVGDARDYLNNPPYRFLWATSACLGLQAEIVYASVKHLLGMPSSCRATARSARCEFSILQLTSNHFRQDSKEETLDNEQTIAVLRDDFVPRFAVESHSEILLHDGTTSVFTSLASWLHNQNQGCCCLTLEESV